MSEQPPIFTIGHSTRSIAEFAEMLQRAQVSTVIDVRTVPRSKRNPQYNEDVLGLYLRDYQVEYLRLAGLGGLRGRSPEVPRRANAFWQNDSFHNYADYALSGEFAAALGELLDLSSSRRCATMCAEAVWWRCHRRIIADYLLASGRTVLHLMGVNRFETAHLTPGAQIAGCMVLYPA